VVGAVRLTSWAQVGARVALARDRAGFSQRELAERLGLNRSAVTRIELGQRQLDALELAALAETLGRSAEWFLTAAPDVVASHRSHLPAGRDAQRLEDELERVSRDVELLLDIQPLPTPPVSLPSGVTSTAEAEARAGEVRELLGRPDGPLHDLQRLVEGVGLLAFSLDLGSNTVDGGYIRLRDVGLALVNGAVEPARRRFNLAHGLGHHVLADAYPAEVGIGAATAEREALIDAFAAHLLLPRSSVRRRWDELADEWPDTRTRLVVMAAEYRVSWTAMLSQALTIELISGPERELLASRRPVAGDYYETGVQPEPELRPVALAPGYLQASVRAYRRGLISGDRAVELLRRTVAVDELPKPFDTPVDALAGEFEDLD
jgi:Zn-dependent peptidase ImmA (M78 family)/DNA-binding XRE family transcriptional regulator